MAHPFPREYGNVNLRKYQPQDWCVYMQKSLMFLTTFLVFSLDDIQLTRILFMVPIYNWFQRIKISFVCVSVW